MAMDLCTAISIVETIENKTHRDIIQSLSSIDATDLKNILFTSLAALQPSINQFLFKKIDYSTDKTVECIKKCFQSPIATINIKESTLLSLPSMIGAHIISFCTMEDRLNVEKTSKDSYILCQIPTAQNQLIIDRKFVEYFIKNKLNKFKYRNIKNLDLKFVFLQDTDVESKYQAEIEMKYYSTLNQILSSTQLDTIKYNLTWKYPQNTLNKNTLQYHLCYRQGPRSGTFLTWINKTNLNFDSVTTLILIPTIGYYRTSCIKQNEITEIVKCLPNLKKFIIPKFDKRHNWISIGNTGIWDLLANNYWNQLIHFEINMMTKEVPPNQHPLSYFYRFNKLQILILTLPYVLQSNHDYYNEIMIHNMSQQQCNDLLEVSLKFDSISCEKDVTLINEVCSYVLSFCPNLSDYTFLVKEFPDFPPFELKYNHLIGHTNSLKRLVVNNCDIFKLKIKMLSLKCIKIYSNYKNAFNTTYLKYLNNFVFTPHLESFVWIDNNSLNREWNDIVTVFLTYFSEQNNIPTTLEKVGLIHETPKSSKKTINKHKSLELCKSIISLSECPTNNIKYIELSPCIIKQKEFEYLSFWYQGKFGHFDWKKHYENSKQLSMHVNLTKYDI